MTKNRNGFSDRRFVLIRGRHWLSNTKRRPILLQAWFAEFADILLKNDSLRHGGHIQRNLGEKGAFDILKSIAKNIKYSRSVFTRLGLPEENETDFRNMLFATLQNVKEIRNDGTHKKITDSKLLSDILCEMVNFCDLLFQYGVYTEKSEYFRRQCISEKNLLTNSSIDLY